MAEMKGKTFRLPDWIIEAIDERAKREHRTTSQVARIIFEREFRRRRKAA